jgi:sugar lactone lactonase YvrE
MAAANGMPDGLTVDSAGNVWCALYGGAKVVCIGANRPLKLSFQRYARCSLGVRS